MSLPEIGARVSVNKRLGYVRFAGAAKFASGDWVGIELDDAVGKNDGSVQGHSYFKCGANKGVFVRPSSVTVVTAEKAPPSKLKSPAPTPSSGIPTSRLKAPSPAPGAAASKGKAQAADATKTGDEQPPSKLRAPSPKEALAVSGEKEKTEVKKDDEPPQEEKKEEKPKVQVPETPTKDDSDKTAAPTTPSDSEAKARLDEKRAQYEAKVKALKRDSVSSGLGQSSGDNSALQNELAAAKAARDKALSELTEANEAKRKAVAQATELEDKLKKAERELSSASAAADDMGKDMEIQVLREKCVQAGKDASKSKEEISGLQKKLVVAQGENETLKENLGSLQKRAEAAESAIKDMQGDATKAGEAAVAAAESRAEEAEQKCKELNAEISSLKEKAVDADTQAVEANAALEKLKEEVSASQEKHKDAMASLKMEGEKLQSRIAELEMSRKELADERDKMAGEVDVLKASLSSMESELSLKASAASAAAAGSVPSEALEAAKAKLSMAERATKAAEKKQQELLDRVNELQDMVESITLDKDIADEKADGLTAEIDTLKLKIEELELEKELLEEEKKASEDSILEGLSPDQAHVAELKSQNDKLKEALKRLNDQAQAEKTSSQKRLRELEKEVAGIPQLLEKNDKLSAEKAKVAELEESVKELKEQLDLSSGFEEMVEDLTGKNLKMGERVKELEATVNDLEELREMSEEMEESHLEVERDLQRTIDAKDVDIQEQVMINDSLNSKINDLERTVDQFRELVRQLQGELRDAKKGVETAGTEASAAKDRETFSTQLELRTMSAKAKGLAVTKELKELEATQAAEESKFLQAFIPDGLLDSADRDCLSLTLQNRRMQRKCEILMSDADNQKMVLASNSPQDGDLAELNRACQVSRDLAEILRLSQTVRGVMQRCKVEEYRKLGRHHREIASVEDILDRFLGMMKKGETFSDSCDTASLHGAVKQFDFTVKTHFGPIVSSAIASASGLAHAGLMASINALDIDVVETHAVVAGAFNSVKLVSVTEGGEDMGADAAEAATSGLHGAFESAFGALRQNRVQVSKVATLLTEMTLADAAVGAVSKMVEQSRSNLSKVKETVNDFAKNVQGVEKVDLATMEEFETLLASDTPLADGTPSVRSQCSTVSTDVSNIAHSVQSGTLQVIEADPKAIDSSPWSMRASSVKEQISEASTLREKVEALKGEVQKKKVEILQKEEQMADADLLKETMERKLKQLSARDEERVALQGEVEKLQKKARTYEEAMESIHNDNAMLEKEVARLKQQAAAGGDPISRRRQSFVPSAVARSESSISMSLETLPSEVASLQCAALYMHDRIRYMRQSETRRKLALLQQDAVVVPREKQEQRQLIDDLVKTNMKIASLGSLNKVVDITKKKSHAAAFTQQQAALMQQRERFETLQARMATTISKINAHSPSFAAGAPVPAISKTDQVEHGQLTARICVETGAPTKDPPIRTERYVARPGSLQRIHNILVK